MPRRITLWGGFHLALFLAFVAGYAVVHYLASFTFPVPWPDESFFLWQSLAFGDHFSLLAPQVNPERPIFLTPPGYPMAVGPIFQIFGFSFQFARGLSFLFIVLSFALLVWMTRKYGLATLALLFCGIFLLSKDFVIAGNSARMESFLLMLVCMGMVLIQRGDDFKGLMLLAVTPLVHPNGLFFVASALVYVLFSGRIRKRRWGRWESVLLAFVALLWLAYAVYALRHWGSFKNDLAWNLGKSHQRGILVGLLNLFAREHFFILLLIFFCAAYAVKEKLAAAFLLVPAVPAWFLLRVRVDMWYSIFGALFYLLFSIVLLHVAAHLFKQTKIAKSNWIRSALLAALVIILLFAHGKAGIVENPLRYPFGMQWKGMTMREGPYYMEDRDVETIGSFLSSLPRTKEGELPTVLFFPRADALFFYPLDGKSVRLIQPSFIPRRPDVTIVHKSRYLPKSLRNQLPGELLRAGIDPSRPGHVLHRRHTSEIWYCRPRGNRGNIP